MKTNAFRKLGQSVLAVILFTAFTQVSSFGQSMANAKPAESMATLETAVYQVPETTKFKVHFLNNSNRKVVIRLLDANQEVVYSETTATKNYIRKFDLDKLHDGIYYFEVTDGKQRVRKQVELQTMSARSLQVQ